MQSDCPLPVAAQVVQGLVDEAAAHDEDYALRSFVDRCPDDLLPSFGRAMGMLVTEAPTGTLDYEPEVYDEERIRSQEATMVEAGRASYFTVAVDRDGEVVAGTGSVWPSRR